jgi:hypothetical protein
MQGVHAGLACDAGAEKFTNPRGIAAHVAIAQHGGSVALMIREAILCTDREAFSA